MRLKWLPNTITVARIVLTLLYLPYLRQFFEGDQSAHVVSLVLAAVIFGSDIVDGFLARRLGVTSKIGTFLDTIADTFFIWGTFFSIFQAGLVSPVILFILISPRIITGLTITWMKIHTGVWHAEHLWSDKAGALAHATAIAVLFIGGFSLPWSVLNPVFISSAVIGIVCLAWGIQERLARIYKIFAR